MGSLERQKRQARWISTLVLVIPATLYVFPLVYLLCMSFKVGGEVMRYPPRILPEHLTLENYQTAFQAAPLPRLLLNSLIAAVSITVLQVSTGVLAAYALARLEFPGRRLIFLLALATMMVPGEVTIIPNYYAMASLGWLDTYLGLIMPFLASGFGMFLLYQFFRTIPKELEEAAIMDGASRWRFLWQFVLPLSKPAITAFAIYAFVNAWNQYLWPLVVTSSTTMQTAQIGLGMFRSQNESTSWGVIMAATTILVAPALALFLLTQRQFVRGMTMSGLKG